MESSATHGCHPLQVCLTGASEGAKYDWSSDTGIDVAFGKRKLELSIEQRLLGRSEIVGVLVDRESGSRRRGDIKSGGGSRMKRRGGMLDLGRTLG